jgi:hypothetical protein
MDEPVFAGDIREREGLLSASITVASADEIKQLFLSYQALKVPFHQTLNRNPGAPPPSSSQIPMEI